jgi:hypothetical protein
MMSDVYILYRIRVAIVRRGLDWMFGFIALIHSNRVITSNTALSLILQFTVTHTLRFSVFTSRVLATDLNTVIIPVSL